MDEHWINKLEVADRQIATSIRLFFEERDIVSIHTLIASAHQILADLGGPSSVKGTKQLHDKELQEHLREINYPYNFFKHADKDPKSKINIAPLESFTSDFIMDAVLMLQVITKDLPIEAKTFWMWFTSKYPQDFEDCPEGGEIKKMINENLSSWEFEEIIKYLDFANIMKENNHSLNEEGS